MTGGETGREGSRARHKRTEGTDAGVYCPSRLPGSPCLLLTQHREMSTWIREATPREPSTSAVLIIINRD